MELLIIMLTKKCVCTNRLLTIHLIGKKCAIGTVDNHFDSTTNVCIVKLLMINVTEYLLWIFHLTGQVCAMKLNYLAKIYVQRFSVVRHSSASL
jgi:hypothetical protein